MHFGSSLRTALRRRATSRGSFAAAIGVQPNHLSQILGGREKVGARMAAKILNEVDPEDRSELLKAYLLDEIGKVEGAAKNPAQALGTLVRIRASRGGAAPEEPDLLTKIPKPTERLLRAFLEHAAQEPAIWRALDAFLAVMVSGKTKT